MNEKIYTVEQAAEILKLHPKTVARYINENKLHAGKIGHQWRITENDLNQFLKKEYKENPVLIEEEYHSDKNLSTQSIEKITVSTVVDISVIDENEGARISNSIIALLNCKDPIYGDSSYKYIYYPEQKKARFLFWGKPIFISHILDIFSKMYDK